MEFIIAHQLPGRIRLRTAPLSADFANTLADRLESLPGITGVRISLRTGSILLLYTGNNAPRDICALLAAQTIPERSLQIRAPQEGALVEAQHAPGWGPFLWYLLVRPLLPMFVRIITALRSALPYIKKGLAALFHGHLNVDVLDASAITISILRGDFGTASLLMLLLGYGEAMEQWTRRKSLAQLAESLRLGVDNVWVRREGQDLRIRFDELRVGDLVVVRDGSAIPVDGTVVEGNALVNQASMTGEPLGVRREPGASVFAGTVVESGELLIRATGVGDNTRVKGIVKYIEESEKIKAGIQGKAERLANTAVPFSFLLAGLVWLATRNLTRAASVLLVDYSCALRLATPLAIMSAMREGVENNILIKGGRYLEGLAGATTVVFDKTGTLTNSRPQVAEVIPAKGYERAEILRLAACLEEHFPHPVARAVVRQAEEEQLIHEEEHARVDYVVAHGICTHVNEKRVLLGSLHYIHNDEHVAVRHMRAEADRLAKAGCSVLYLASDGKLIGLIGLNDPPRPEAREVIQALREAGIRRIVMLTGDDKRAASTVARQLGIDEYRAEILPVDKAGIVTSLHDEGETVLMVGDGINDSPALSAADAGVTLKDGADLAREVAGVVLTASDLHQLLAAIQLGRSAMRRIQTNFALTLSLNTLFLAGGLAGVLGPGISALLHNLTTLGVCFNASRHFLPKGGNI